MEDKNYWLILSYFDKTISDDGLTQLQEWIEEHPDNLEMFSETIQILGASKGYFKQPEHTAANWAKISAHIHAEVLPEEKKTIKASRLKWMMYAAIFFLIAVAGLMNDKMIFHRKALPVDYAQINNPDGQHSKIVLPDSSVIYLGGGSKLRYARKFDGAERTVYLDGEAFFDVVHQSKRPFVVKSGNIATVVLGTSFNIKAFTAKNSVAVTVNTGKVGVMSNLNGKSRLVKFLTPNEQMEINTLTGLYTFNTTDAQAVSGWRDNNFVYYNTPLKEIAASLEHHYGVKIEFTDNILGESRLTAKFNSMSLHQIMDNLAELSSIAYTQKGNHFFISNTNQKGGRIMK
ncbi:FecR family protein [Pedobacter sp. AW31-3R]|uniref:FecR family protein n=1 Tax=Pedobacter sp. AW31-3R TaxID=3445781 RepID=UPI003FA0CA6D